MAETSVGVISLDLVIKNRISEQLDSMKSSITSEVSRAFESSAAASAGKLRSAFDALFSRVSGSAAKGVEKTMSKAASAVQAKSEEITETIQQSLGGFEVSSDPLQRLEQQLENTQEKIGILQKRWQELQTSLENTEDDAGAAKIIEQLNAVESRMLSLQGNTESISSKIAGYAESTASDIEQQSSLSTEITIKCLNALGSSAKRVFAAVIGVSRKAFDTIKNVGGKAFRSLKNIGSKAIDGLKSKFSKLGSSVSSVNKPLGKLGKSIKGVLKATFLTAGLYAVFRGLKSLMQNAVSENEEFAKSLNEVKTNLSVAFQPIIEAAMPAINALMSGLASLTRQIAEFTNEIFGTTYKKSLETVKKVKEVGKEAKKNSTYLNSYDVMNVAQSTDSSDSSSSDSGSDDSAIGSDVKLTDWAQRMKDAISSGDWSGVGALLAEKVNGVFGAVNWEKIRAKAKAAVDGIADVFNGFVKNVNWKAAGKDLGEGINTVFATTYELLDRVDFDTLGSSLAEGLNSAVETTDFSLVGRTFAKKWNSIIDILHGFVTKFDFKGLGKKLSDGVDAWFDEIDYKKAAMTLSEGIKGILDTGIQFLQNTDWRAIGKKISDFIATIDWKGIVSKTFELIGSAIGAAVSLLWGAIQNAVYSIRDYFRGKIQDCGGNIVEGLWTGIKDAFKNAAKWIKDNIVTPFINGFKKAFGIASPSKVMAQLGGYIIQGLYNGISAGIDKIKKLCSKLLSAIKDTFKNIGSWFKSKFESAYNNICSAFSGIGKFFVNAYSKVKEPFVKIGSWFGDKFKAAYSSITKIFNPMAVSKTFLSIKNAIVGAFKSIPAWFKSTFTTAWTNVKNVFSKGGKVFSGITSGIAETFKKIVNKLIDGINDVVAFPFEKINDMLNTIHDISILGKKPFSDLWDKDPLPVPEIPHLAKGGLVKAPTLALVGDNQNAASDPEVVSPLSKLRTMIGQSSGTELAEIKTLLRAILEAIKSGKTINLYLGESGVKLLTQEVINAINDKIASTGQSPINW